MAVSSRTGHVEAGPSAGTGRLGWGLLAFPCLQVGEAVPGGSGWEAGSQVVLLPLKSPTGKCLT